MAILLQSPILGIGVRALARNYSLKMYNLRTLPPPGPPIFQVLPPRCMMLATHRLEVLTTFQRYAAKEVLATLLRAFPLGILEGLMALPGVAKEVLAMRRTSNQGARCRSWPSATR